MAVVGEADFDEVDDPHALAMATSVAAAPIIDTRVRLVVAGFRRRSGSGVGSGADCCTRPPRAAEIYWVRLPIKSIDLII